MIDTNPIIMVVEDDLVDTEAVRRRITKRGLPYHLVTAEDGCQALECLRSDQFTTQQRERLVVFLDINMPGMNGHQFLEQLREDPLLRRTIVFVLTTSSHDRDRSIAYDRNVAGYFVKSNIDGLLDTVAAYAKSVEWPPVAHPQKSGDEGPSR